MPGEYRSIKYKIETEDSFINISGNKMNFNENSENKDIKKNLLIKKNIPIQYTN